MPRDPELQGAVGAAVSRARGPEGARRGDLEFRTIGRLVRVAADRYPDVDALVDGEVRLTFGQLADAVDGSCRAAMAHGLEPGDTAAVWAPNLGEWVVAALGLVAAGVVLVPLNTRFKGSEAAWILAKSRARALFCVNGFLGNDYVAMLHRSAGRLPDLETVVVLRGEAPAGTVAWSNYLAAGSLVTDDASEVRAGAVGPESISDIIFTSGTTGQPKGAMISHGQTLRVFSDWVDIVGLSEGDRYLMINPYFHTFGYKAGIMACLISGTTMYPQATFDVPTVLRTVEAERITMLPGPPTVFQAILDHPGRAGHDLSSLRLAVTGAAVVPVDLVHRIREELHFGTIITAYGLGESSGVVTMCRADDDAETVATTSGRAIPDVELAVVGDDGDAVPVGEPGEVVTRGYHVMAGYLDEPGETARAIDTEGWLRTGDVGVLDRRGYLRITDRKKDMFIVGGFNVYPAEVEATLRRHPDVGQAAVIGIPDRRLGEVGAAFVVPRPGATARPDDVIAWAAGEMANFKVPRRVIVVDALPVNAAGKVVKAELRAQAAQPQAAQPLSPEAAQPQAAQPLSQEADGRR